MITKPKNQNKEAPESWRETGLDNKEIKTMSDIYNISQPEFNQFKNTFEKLVKETKAVLLDNNPLVAEYFEKNAEDFIKIIEVAESIKKLNYCAQVTDSKEYVIEHKQAVTK